MVKLTKRKPKCTFKSPENWADAPEFVPVSAAFKRYILRSTCINTYYTTGTQKCILTPIDEYMYKYPALLYALRPG